MFLAWQGRAWQVLAGHGLAWPGMAWHGEGCKFSGFRRTCDGCRCIWHPTRAWLGRAGLGLAWRGTARQGAARHGVAGRGSARQGLQVSDFHRVRWLSVRCTTRGGAGLGKARLGAAWHCWAWRGLARLGEARAQSANSLKEQRKMIHYQVTLTGKTPLLMHWDNIEWADEMDAWKTDPANQKGSKAGDDRSPAWRWIGSVYRDIDNKHISIPSDNLMRCLMEGGVMVPVPGGKGGKTFKAQTQSGMMTADLAWPLLISGKPVPLTEIDALRSQPSYVQHLLTVRQQGFDLLVKRAKVGTSKHIRVRPIFRDWSATGVLHVWDKQLTQRALTDILTYAGNYKGLGDWRPSSPKSPGSYGMFDAAVQEVA